jgi:hypothetical protein
MNETDDAPDAPLDPATERVRRKMVRLLAVSIGIMFIGVMAVLFAVVYRVGGEAQLAEGAEVPLMLPAGAMILEAGMDGDRLFVRVSAEGGEELVVYDRNSGAVLSRHPLVRP